MSEDDTNSSLLTNLKNKVSYKITQAVTDPKANEFAKQQKEKEKKEKEDKLIEKADAKAEADKKKEGDPNTFSGTRVIKKIGTQTAYIFKIIIIPFTALMLSMIIANEMIVYSAPIRIIFFVFTFLVCYFLPFYAILLAIFYTFKGGYSYYINNMTAGPKRTIMPTIFALLPITTYKPSSSLWAFFMYPFIYPKTEIASQTLPELMKNYWNSLVESFKGYDTVKNLPLFVDDIRKLQSDLSKIHEVTPSVNQSINQ